jgi:NAD(P)-dependent dehydrogenase (short-subunit alcohol dehydrogenase family)
MAVLPKYTDAEANDRSFMKGKAMLITGATSGLGAELINEICALGSLKPARVVIVARDAGKAAATAAQLQAAGEGGVNQARACVFLPAAACILPPVAACAVCVCARGGSL